MKKGLLVLSLVFAFVFLFNFVSATTTISDTGISTTGALDIGANHDGDKFVLSNGNFAHKPGLIEEVSCLRDNSSNGTAQYLGGARDVFVQGKYAYVVGLDDDSLSVVDISNPENISEISGITDNSVGGNATGLAGALGIYVVGNYAYIVSRDDNALDIIDISDPSNLTEVGVLFDNATLHLASPSAIYVAGGYAYIDSGADNAFTVVDVRDPTNPREVGALISNSTAHIGDPLSMSFEGKYAYIVSKSQFYLTAIDVSNPTNPVWVGELANDGTNFLRDVATGGIYTSGKYAYIASNTADSLSVIDISNPRDMTFVSMITDDNKGGNASALDKAKKVFIAGKYAYVTSITDAGFSVFDVSDPNNLTQYGYLQDDSVGGNASCLEQPQGVFVQGKYAYVTAKSDNGLSVIDIGGIDTPSISTGSVQSNILSVTEFAQIMGDLYIKSTLNIGGKAWFGDAVSVLGKIRAIGGLTVGDGTNQVNITMTSPDGTAWCCGVSDDGSWGCASGACS